MTIGTLMQGQVGKLLQIHGYDLTFRRSIEGAYDASTGATAAATTDDETVRGIFLSYEAMEIDGTSVQRGDRKLVIAAPTTKTPQSKDVIIGEGDPVAIINVKTIKSGATVMAYVCQTRK